MLCLHDIQNLYVFYGVREKFFARENYLEKLLSLTI